MALKGVRGHVDDGLGPARIRIKAGNHVKLLTTRFDERLPYFHVDLFDGFEAIRHKSRADQFETADAFFRQFFGGRLSGGLKPRIVAQP